MLAHIKRAHLQVQNNYNCIFKYIFKICTHFQELIKEAEAIRFNQAVVSVDFFEFAVLTEFGSFLGIHTLLLIAFETPSPKLLGLFPLQPPTKPAAERVYKEVFIICYTFTEHYTKFIKRICLILVQVPWLKQIIFISLGSTSKCAFLCITSVVRSDAIKTVVINEFVNKKKTLSLVNQSEQFAINSKWTHYCFMSITVFNPLLFLSEA